MDWKMQCAELSGQSLPSDVKYSLVFPGSSCPSCGHKISALENIPLISYVFLRGSCRSCNSHISLRYPVVELVTGLLFGFCAYKFGVSWQALGAMILSAAMIALSVIDFDTQLLPDDITLPLMWVGLVFNFFGVYTDLPSAVWGAIAGYLSLWCVYWLFKLVTGKEGMGYGDFKLLAAIGAWLGWQSLLLTILISSFVGAIVGVALIVIARRGRDIPMPFGPYLAVAGLIAMFWGKYLTNTYLGYL